MTYQPNQQAELQTAIKAISSQCDGAIVRDGVGFNASDTTLGKSLALLPAILWDQDVAAAAWGMLSHYRAQLTALSIDFDKIDQVKPTTSEREGRRSAIHHAHAAVQSSKVSERSTLTLNASGVIILTSPYNGDLLKDVRAVAGRSWDAQHNVNRFLAESVRAVLDLAAKWNIPVPATIEALPDATLIDQTEADKEPEPLGLEIDDDKIIIRFPYHPDVNQDLRMMVTGSVFSSIGHCWKTDISNSIGALKFATKHGLTIQPGVAEAIQKAEESPPTPRSCSGKSTLSRTVFHGSSASRWNKNPTPSVIPPTGLPRTVIAPLVGRSSPEISESVVDFPQPDGPTSATNRSGATSRFTSRSAV